MGIDCTIKLPAHARINDVATVVGILAGLPVRRTVIAPGQVENVRNGFLLIAKWMPMSFTAAMESKDVTILAGYLVDIFLAGLCTQIAGSKKVEIISESRFCRMTRSSWKSRIKIPLCLHRFDKMQLNTKSVKVFKLQGIAR